MNEIESSNLESVRKVRRKVACVPKGVRKKTGRSNSKWRVKYHGKKS